MEKISKTDQEWREQLTEEQYRVLRQAGTERPFTGQYVDSEEEGIYTCAACGNNLFSSGTKFHSGSGWPSFWDVVSQGNVETHQDNSHGMQRSEIVCGRAGLRTRGERLSAPASFLAAYCAPSEPRSLIRARDLRRPASAPYSRRDPSICERVSPFRALWGYNAPG